MSVWLLLGKLCLGERSDGGDWERGLFGVVGVGYGVFGVACESDEE